MRPDCDYGASWTKEAVKGMKAKKAYLYCAKLFYEEYAFAVLNQSPNDKVIGYVLSHADTDFFNQKLKMYDSIEDYFPDDPANSDYLRSVVEVHLCDENDMPTLDLVTCFVYHKL